MRPTGITGWRVPRRAANRRTGNNENFSFYCDDFCSPPGPTDETVPSALYVMKISCSVFKRYTFPFTLVSVPTNTYRKNLLQCYNRLTVAAADRDHLTTRIASSTVDTGTRRTTDTSLTHLIPLAIHITAMFTEPMDIRHIIRHILTCIKMRKESTKVLIRAIGILLIFEETLTIAKGRCLQKMPLNCKHWVVAGSQMDLNRGRASDDSVGSPQPVVVSQTV